MFFKYRPAMIRDLGECQHSIRDGFAYDDSERADLVALWKELLTSGATSAMVIEDAEAPPGERVLWFCIKVFLPDEYAHHLKTEAPAPRSPPSSSTARPASRSARRSRNCSAARCSGGPTRNSRNVWRWRW